MEEGQQEQKAKDGAKALVARRRRAGVLRRALRRAPPRAPAGPDAGGGGRPGPARLRLRQHHRQGGRALAGQGELLFSCYALSKGNPIEDAQALFRQVREAAGFTEVGALALTGYGKDLLRDVLGADVAIVETVAHATAALHYFPDADVICDVGGTDVKIMLLRQGTVADFRLNSQCSSGNGAFLQGVAERYGIPLEGYAERAFAAKAMPSLAMGCGVFLQSDIVNQQRKGWAAEEIMAALAAVLPVNVWIYAGQLQNLRAAGRKFVLQGGTHRNMAVVKAQVDFITSKVPEAEVVVHPYSGEAGAIGAALCAGDWRSDRPAVALPRLRHHRGADLHQHDQRGHRLPLVPRQLHADLHRRAAARRPGARVEQGAAGRGLGARHQRQLVPEGARRGRQRDADGEGEAGGGQA